jgi:dipeptidyl aminopeptidase/acylaminoacyl peptidase
MAQFIKMRWPGRATLAPDGTLYFVYNPDGIRQLYKVAPGKTQKDAVKLTTFEDGIGGYSLSDDGKWIGITASVGGSEQADLFLMNTKTGKLETLFSDPNAVYGSVTWRRDSKAFAYRANDTSPSNFYVYQYNLDTKSHQTVFEGKGYYYPVDYDRTGERLMIGKYNSASFSQIFEVTVAAQQAREITPEGEKWSFDPIGYSYDDRYFLTNTNYRRDLKSIHAIDTKTREPRPVLSDINGWEVDGGALNNDRTVLAVAVNEDGYSTLHLRRTSDYTPVAGSALDKGIVGNINFQGKYMLYSLNNAKTPGVIYKWNINKPEESAVAVTVADTQGVDLSKFRLPELVHYPSFDGEKIPAFLYLPGDYKNGSEIPFIVQYHGGPEGQYRPYFNRSYQFLLSRGYGIIAPNVRGSSGYGKAYIEADNYKNRMVSVKDGIYAARYVIDQGYAKKGNVGAWGGSYGGFMTMAVITEEPDLFGAACNVVGVVNFETFLEQTKAYRRKLREVEYGPLTDRAFLKSISPIHKIDRITAPLMLAHGLNDPRVPIGEAMQVAVALKKRGIDVEELYFPDEGHGFAKEANRLLYYEELARFFDKHLKN